MNNYELSKLQAHAKDIFSNKPFGLKFFGVFKLAKYTSPVLSLFSVITGFGFLYYVLKPSLPPYIAAGIAIVLLLIVELGKRMLGKIFFAEAYGERQSMAFFFSVLVALFIGASIYMSVIGAENLVNNSKEKIEAMHSDYTHKNDSLNYAFMKLRQDEIRRHDAFIKAVSWKGSIDVSNRAVKAAIEKHNITLANLDAERLKNVEILRNDKENTTSTIKAKTYSNMFYISIISGINEVFIMLCVWFQVYFLFRIDYERRVIEHETPQRQINEGISNFGIIQPLLDDLRKGENRFNILAERYKVNAKIIAAHKKMLVN